MLEAFEYIQSLYAAIERLNISVTMIAVLAAILVLGFLFAVREAASWFFKVDDIKRDVRELRDLTLHMEAELRALQTLLNPSQATAKSLSTPAPAAADVTSAPPPPASKAKPSSGAFPIVH